MDEEGSFIFYENDYQPTSFSAFQDMRIKEEHTDLTIKTKDRQFSVHRVIIAARIPHFRKVLTSKHKEISLNDLDSDVLDSIINFAYEGKLKVTLENLQPMLFAAVCLHLYKVQVACLEFQAKRFNSNREVNIINLIPSDLSIRNNFDELCNSREFLLLPYYSVKELIGRDDLKVQNEEKVFEALIQWVKESPTERQPHLPYLLPEIRMNYLSAEYLVETVAEEMIIATSARAKQIVEDAKSYHLLKKRPMFLSFNPNPRLYSYIQDRASCDLSSTIATNQNDLFTDGSKVPPRRIVTTNPSDLRISGKCNFSPNKIHATDQNDLIFGDARNFPGSDILASNQNGLISTDTNNILPCNNVFFNQNDLTPSRAGHTPSNNILATNQSDLTPSHAGIEQHPVTMASNNILATNQSDLTPSDADNTPSNNILATCQSDLTPSDAANTPSNNILATYQSDLTPSDAANTPLNNILATNQSLSVPGDRNKILPTNEDVLTPDDASNACPSINNASPSTNNASPSTNNASPSTNNASPSTSKISPNTSKISPNTSYASPGTSDVSPNTSYRSSFKHGIYAVRSFKSTGTFVSYYNHRNKKWDDFSSTSHNDLVQQAVSVGEELYVFFPKSIETFHLVTYKWKTVERLSISTEGSGVVSQGNKIYIFGGVHEPDQVRCFDTEKNKWLQNRAMQVPSHSMSVVSSPKRFVLHTGGSNTSCTDAFSVFYTATNHWTDMPPMITCRMNHDSAVSCSKFYVCGGGNDEVQFLETVEVYDNESRQWNFVSLPSIYRVSHSLVSWKKKLLVFGGKTEQEICCCSVEIYDPVTDKWMSPVPVQAVDTNTVARTTDRLCSEETVPVTMKVIVAKADNAK